MWLVRRDPPKQEDWNMSNILLAILLAAATPPFDVHTLDGKTLSGPITELTTERLSVETAGGQVSLKTGELLLISAANKPAGGRTSSGVVVELVDGSTIVGQQFTAEANRAAITLLDGKELAAPTAIVRSVRFQQKSGPLATEWSRLGSMKTDSDLLVVFKDQTIDYHKGVLQDVTADVVRFSLDGDLLPVKRSKIYGIAYRHVAAAEMPAAVCRIVNSSGSRWSADSLNLAEELQWSTPAGLSLSEPMAAIVKIDFSAGKLAYLSDLRPDSATWTPYFGTLKPLAAMEQFYAPRFDCNFDGSPLRLGGVPYEKGLALHSRTELLYRLPAPYRRFQATAGIDDAVRPAGKVRLTVRGDDKVLLETVVAGGDAPQAIDLDVSGVRRLTIVADFGDGPGPGDHLLLCDARLSK